MDGPPAVFISYARDDLEAAGRIADRLRAAGIVVWLDLTELRGGDTWDAKIKRQIRECALFLAIISDATQRRREGYFRLEWLMAEERSRLMARGTPFLVPVAIDATSEREALVPESFLAVQWSRLPRGEASPAFVDRVQSLLGLAAPEAAASPRRPGAPAPAPARRQPGPHGRLFLLGSLAVLGFAAVALLVALHPWRVYSRRSGDASEIQRAMQLITSNEVIPDDLSLAESILKSEQAKNPSDPNIAAVLALDEVTFLFRGFDRSLLRRDEARRRAEQAVKLKPDNPLALEALGIYLYSSGTDLARAQDVLEQAIALDPNNPVCYRFRDDALFVNSQVTSAQAIASAEATAARFPRDALSHYELARHYRDVGRLQDMERELDRTIAIEPVVNALVWKARTALWVRGDPQEMKGFLDQVPARGRTLERWAMGQWIYAMATGKTALGLTALDNITESWVHDFDYYGPTELLRASLLDQAGRRELARLQYQAALNAVKTYETQNAADDEALGLETWCLHGLGRDDEAHAMLARYNETLEHPYRLGFGKSWWFTPVPLNLLLGNRDFALKLLREAAAPAGVSAGEIVRRNADGDVSRNGFASDNFRLILGASLRADPRMAPWRNDPGISAILTHGPLAGP